MSEAVTEGYVRALPAETKAALLGDWSNPTGSMIWDCAKDGLGLANAVGLTPIGHVAARFLKENPHVD